MPGNFEYGHWLADKIFELIQEAIAAERGPAKVEFGVGNGYFIFSRGNAPVDYEIQVLKVSQNSQPIALLFNHPTHPAQASANLIGPGHPGWAMDEIEAVGVAHAEPLEQRQDHQRGDALGRRTQVVDGAHGQPNR